LLHRTGEGSLGLPDLAISVTVSAIEGMGVVRYLQLVQSRQCLLAQQTLWNKSYGSRTCPLRPFSGARENGSAQG
jgi:hypothetical protein